MVPSWTASLATSATLGSTLTRSQTLSHRDLATATHEAPIPAPQPSLVNNNITRSLSLSSDDDQELDRDQNDDDPPRALAAVISPVASLLALFGVDPGGQGAQVALTVFACRSQKQRRSSESSSLEDWLSTLSISPFFPLGLLWGTLGNVLLGGGLLLLHTLAVLVWHHTRLLRGADNSSVVASETTVAAALVEEVQDDASGCSSRGCGWEAAASSAAEGLRFPSLSVAALEWLLPGIALCGAAVVANTDGEQGAGAQAVGWLCLVACAGVIGGWYIVARYAAGRCTIGPPVAFTSPPLFFPAMYELLAQRMSWEPTSVAQRFGTFLVAVRSTGLWWWRWVSVALLTVVAALTGASASHPDACIAALSMSAALLLVSALCIALVQPYALPSENALNPLKLLILAVTCLVLLAKHQQQQQAPDDDASWGEDALLALGASQLSVTLLRGLVKGYLRVAVCGISSAPPAPAPAASAPPPATSSAAAPCPTTTTNSNDMAALASSVGSSSQDPLMKQEDPPRRNVTTQEKEESFISMGSCDDEPTARVQEVEREREMRLFQFGNHHREDDVFSRVQREDDPDAATSLISAPPQTSEVLLPTTTWISYERDEDVIL